MNEITKDSAGTMIKLPISLKIVLAIALLKVGGALLISILQFTFVAYPPTSGIALQAWGGMQSGMGAKAMDPIYVAAYMFPSLLLWVFVLLAIFRRSKFWLNTARVFFILSILCALGGLDPLSATGWLLMVILLYSKGAKAYVAKTIS